MSNNKVIISGLGWSGSGALLDYLMDAKCIKGFWMEYPSETHFLNSSILMDIKKAYFTGELKPFSKADFIYLISAGKYEINGLNNKQKINQILDFRLIKRLKVRKKYNQKALSYIFEKEPAISKFVSHREHKNDVKIDYETLFEAVDINCQSESIGINQIIKSYYKTILYLADKFYEVLPKKKIVFNNDAHLYNDDSLLNMDNFIKFVVIRNPIFIYSNRLYVRYDYNMGFIKRFKYLLSYAKDLNIQLIRLIFKFRRENINIISFEKFTKDNNERLRVLEKIGCRAKFDNMVYYNNSYSISNLKFNNDKLKYIDKFMLVMLTFPFYLTLLLLSRPK